jgi:hypothetical protein
VYLGRNHHRKEKVDSNYFKTLRVQREALEAKFPEGCCLVISVDNLNKASTAGHVCEVTTTSAAQLLVDGTHRLVTEAEATKFRQSEALARAQANPIDSLQSARARFDAIIRKEGTQ